LNKNLIEFYS